MRNKMSDRASVLFLLAVFVLSSAVPSDGRNVVEIGPWAIHVHRFSLAEAPVWTASASIPENFAIREKCFIKIAMFAHAEKASIPVDAHSLELPGAGTIFFDVAAQEEKGPGQPAPVGVYYLERKFFWPHNGQCTVLTRQFERGQWFWSVRQPGEGPAPMQISDEQKEAIKAEKVARAVQTVGECPEMNLLRLMLTEDTELARYGVAVGYPILQASIDAGQFQELESAGTLGRTHYGWKLPAHPGQEVVFRIHFDGVHAVVTTRGVKITEGIHALRGKLVGIRQYSLDEPFSNKPEHKWIQGQVNQQGWATVEYGVLKSPLLLQLRFGDWKSSGSLFRGCIFLRWGRPEEKWRNRFPLAESPQNRSPASCIRCILQDLESAYDPDRGEFLARRGDSKTYTPSFHDLVALQELDLEDYPHLSALRIDLSMKQWIAQAFKQMLYGLNIDPGKGLTAEQLAGKRLAFVTRSGFGARLTQDLKSHWHGSPSGWHNPRAVYALAVFWERFPQMQKENPLEQVLDYWVKAIPKRSAPLRGCGKWDTCEDPRPISRGYAIAALHLGYEIFGKSQYAARRDELLRSMQTTLEGHECYKAMIAKGAWCIDRHWDNYELSWRPMCAFVSVYAQTCAFIGNDAELGKAQNWIVSALVREGKKDANPFRNYQTATFTQRCGMIATLRGQAGYLAVPVSAND